MTIYEVEYGRSFCRKRSEYFASKKEAMKRARHMSIPFLINDGRGLVVYVNRHVFKQNKNGILDMLNQNNSEMIESFCDGRKD